MCNKKQGYKFIVRRTIYTGLSNGIFLHTTNY